jgi:hypothetical protein
MCVDGGGGDRSPSLMLVPVFFSLLGFWMGTCLGQLDCGTDNEALLNDEHYLGVQHRRLVGDAYYKYVGCVVACRSVALPGGFVLFLVPCKQC